MTLQPGDQKGQRRQELFRRGAARLIEQAPSMAGALAAGGWLGLLAACSLHSLLLPQTLALPAIMKLLEALGLNVMAGYLGDALKDVWRRTGRPEAREATRAEIAMALQRIAEQHEDATVEIAQAARASGALQRTLDAINAHVAGSEALWEGLRRDTLRSGAVLAALQVELRDVKQGVRAVFHVAEETRRDTAAMRPQIDAIYEQGLAGERQRREREQMLLRDYLGTLGKDCNRLSLADADTSDPNKAAVDLDSVYVRLEITRVVQDTRVQELRHLTALEAFAQQPRLVLLGAPGSGKSTFVNFLARCLALATLEDRQRWLDRLGAEWTHGALIPIHIVLREFAAWLAGQKPRIARGDARLPWSFLAEKHGAALAEHLRRLAHEGRALLLLDGLDEVGADEEYWPLIPVRESIVALASGLGNGSRALVTCRVLDYQHQQRQLVDWPSDMIEPLSEPLREQFIHNWYAELERLRRPLDDTGEVLEQRLTRALRERLELRRLAGNPLLLTMMVLVHSYKGRLPEGRVKLYEECIEFLLHRWRRRTDERPLRERLGLDQGQWTEKNLLELLYLLGHIAHRQAVNRDGESGADLSYRQVIDTAQRYFEARFGIKRSAGRAEEFAEFMGQASNGLLQVHSNIRDRDTIYRFPHRTFQEYLAGHALVNGDLLLEQETPDDERDLVARALRYVDTGAQWREALLLAAVRLVLNGSSRQVVELAQALLPDDPAAPLSAAQARRIMLAGELLAEVGGKLVAGMGRHLAPTWDETRDHLLRLLPHPPSIPLPPLAPVERSRAALILARLGDPRPGVCTLQPSWCEPIPAGEYLIGTQPDTFNKNRRIAPHRVRLDEFRIARYPVTVWQFRRFWEDPQGYEHERWWPKSGWAWKQSRHRTKPHLWDDPDWTADNQPVVHVSWYEAVAFCNWLTRRGKREGWLKSDEVIRLPSEAEWEVAAVWDKRKQEMRPWQPPDGEIRQNVEEAGIGRTAPVGLFPLGASPCGALDMAGNVWEWCGSAYDDYPQAAPLREDFSLNGMVSLRGGVYYLQNAHSSYGARYRFGPGYNGDLDGFRVVVAPRLAR